MENLEMNFNESFAPTLFREPMFLLGISQRSGTNFLANLLCLHPDCSLPAPIQEDYVLHCARPLMDYADGLYASWVKGWGITPSLKDDLSRHLGYGLLSFLCSRTKSKRLLTKMPSVQNLDSFFRLFPKAYLLILVRDGRSVTESYAKSFHFSYERAMRKWAAGARTIVDFHRVNSDLGLNYMIVKYESLVSDTEREISKVLNFLKLDRASYDLKAALNLPVFGSCMYKDNQGKVHWNPVQKTADFDPLNRFSHWKKAKHERFRWIGSKYNTELGYTQQGYHTGWFHWSAWNALMDVKWYMVETFRLTGQQLRKTEKLRKAFNKFVKRIS